jgi:hypothetical protein
MRSAQETADVKVWALSRCDVDPMQRRIQGPETSLQDTLTIDLDNVQDSTNFSSAHDEHTPRGAIDCRPTKLQLLIPALASQVRNASQDGFEYITLHSVLVSSHRVW